MQTKICSQCKHDLPITEFYSKPNRLYSSCKSCFNKQCQKRWIQRKINAIQYKGSSCTDCGLHLENTHYSVFEFHHLDPSQKDFDWSKLRLLAATTIKVELNKCILLCANCHRIRHYS